MAPSPHQRLSPPPRSLALTLLLPLLLWSPSLPAAAAAAPSPPSAPAPLRTPPRQVASASGTGDTPVPPHPRRGHRNHHRRPPPPPPPRAPSKRRLNFGERLGITLAGVAVAMQVVLGAFLAVRAWQLRRLEKAEVSSSTPVT